MSIPETTLKFISSTDEEIPEAIRPFVLSPITLADAKDLLAMASFSISFESHSVLDAIESPGLMQDSFTSINEENEELFQSNWDRQTWVEIAQWALSIIAANA